MIENVKIDTQQELLKIEGEWIKKPNTANISMPGRTMNEYDSEGNKHYTTYDEVISNDEIIQKTLIPFVFQPCLNQDRFDHKVGNMFGQGFFKWFQFF